MKKDYTNPVMDIIKYDTPDVILTSGLTYGGTGNNGTIVMTTDQQTFSTYWLHN